MTNVINLNRERAQRTVEKSEDQRLWDFRFNLDRLLADYSDLSQFTLINELTASMLAVENGIFGKK